MKITDYIKEKPLFLDGGMGTQLSKAGLAPGELPERWNLTHSQAVYSIHKSYYDSGSNVVNTNTFGANSLKFDDDELDKIIYSAIANAKRAAKDSSGSHEKWIALDIGPLGRMLKPYGDLDLDEAVEIFAKTVRLGVKYGADLIFIETMSDTRETKAAVLAAKENASLPIFVSNAYGENGRLLTGATPEAMICMLEGMGVDAIGINCSLGPEALAPVIEKYIEYSSTPIIFKPNAGLPHDEGGVAVFDVNSDDFSLEMYKMYKSGVTILGGCCGTTPEYIEKTKNLCESGDFKLPESKNLTWVSSGTEAVIFGNRPVLIGERINPTGKARFKEALRRDDMDYILDEGLKQETAGAQILDVNVGIPEIDEVKMLTDAVLALQAVTNLPLQLDTSNPAAMEAALRRYSGKPMINSVNGKAESLCAVLPLVKKYGGLVVALTLDDKGIPEMAEGRIAIAEKILTEAEKYGLSKKDIIFDPLALTISADSSAAKETLRAVRQLTDMGAKTSLGVSNVSFGLPSRDIINSTFFSLAMSHGLSAAIMNPYSERMMEAYYSSLALFGLDENCAGYIKSAEGKTSAALSIASPAASSTLQEAIVKGLCDKASAITRELLKTKKPLDIIDGEIVPALDSVGIGFEEKRVYLPSLLMSAEAAKASFDVIKASMSGGASSERCTVILATVKGDIHDIGKNIVKVILENYGFPVIDLGKDVDPHDIVAAAIKYKAPLVGLSALMTTTVPAMAETIKLLRAEAPFAKIVVGGAVLTEEYAMSIDADKYAADAMETVRYAEKIDSISKR